MEKVLELLEKHCQWIAVGLGGLFLTWMLISYVLISPVVITTPDGRSLSPADVDDTVRNTVGKPLDDEINNPAAVQAPRNPNLDPQVAFNAALTGQDRQVASLPPNWSSAVASTTEIREKGNEEYKTNGVTGSPKIAPVEIVNAKTARAYVQPFVDVANPNAQPQQPVAQPGVLPVGGRDLTYTRIHYKIPGKLIADAFREVRIPNGVSKTSVLAVRIERQEMLPDGKWSEAKPVAPLQAGGTVPLPPANAPAVVLNDFEAKVKDPNVQANMLRPAFFPVALGEGPWDPPAELPKVDLESEAKERLDRARLEAEERQRNRQPNTPRNPRGGPGGPPADEAPMMDGEGNSRPGGGGRGGRGRGPTDFRQIRPPVPNEAERRQDFMGMDDGLNGNPGFGGGPAQPGQPPTEGSQTPGEFTPGADADPNGWAYDTNVEEGKTYRYRIVYAIRNPMFNASKNQFEEGQEKLAEQFFLWSDTTDAGWTQPVTVPNSTFYYLANSGWVESSIPNSIRFEVFKWALGQWRMATLTASPGDKIATVEGQVPFDTNTRLVDVRFDTKRGNSAYVLVIGPDGKLIERDIKTDKDDVHRLALRRAVEAAAANTPPVASRP